MDLLKSANNILASDKSDWQKLNEMNAINQIIEAMGTITKHTKPEPEYRFAAITTREGRYVRAAMKDGIFYRVDEDGQPTLHIIADYMDLKWEDSK